MMIHWQPGVTLEVLEQEAIEAAFKFYQNNKTATANSLGISIRTLDAKLEKYGDDRKKRDDLDNKRKGNDADFQRRQRYNGADQFYHNSGNAPAVDPARAVAGAKEKTEGTKDVSSPAAGERVEPTTPNSTQQPVSVQKSQEVQKVLHGKPAESGARRAR